MAVIRRGTQLRISAFGASSTWYSKELFNAKWALCASADLEKFLSTVSFLAPRKSSWIRNMELERYSLGFVYPRRYRHTQHSRTVAIYSILFLQQTTPICYIMYRVSYHRAVYSIQTPMLRSSPATLFVKEKLHEQKWVVSKVFQAINPGNLKQRAAFFSSPLQRTNG